MKKLIPMTLLSLLSAAALADSTSQYKMAVIEDSKGSQAIQSGAYQRGILSITQTDSTKDIYQQVAEAMNLCVAYANLQQIEQAQQACDRAISLIEESDIAATQSKNIVSFAFNNRAIFKTKIKDYNGALNDLLTSMEINNNKVAKNNLIKLLKDQRANMQFKS